MQYILTEEEMAEIKKTSKHEISLSRAKLQTLCTKIADEMPVKFWQNKEASPWGCKLTIEDNEGGEWYCDNCPVQTICPSDDKDYSK